jgi:hypothetical protein
VKFPGPTRQTRTRRSRPECLLPPGADIVHESSLLVRLSHCLARSRPRERSELGESKAGKRSCLALGDEAPRSPQEAQVGASAAHHFIAPAASGSATAGCAPLFRRPDTCALVGCSPSRTRARRVLGGARGLALRDPDAEHGLRRRKRGALDVLAAEIKPPSVLPRGS